MNRRIALATALSACIACGSKTGLWIPDETADAAIRSDAAVADAAVDDDDHPEPAACIATTNEDAVRAALSRLRWELPCKAPSDARACSTFSRRELDLTVPGAPCEQFRVTVRIRGVLELKDYQGGSNDGAFWQIEGTPGPDTINVYGLTIASPPQRYYVNRMTRDAFACFALDYTRTLVIDGGSHVQLVADSIDSREVRNYDTAGRPIVIAGVPPAPEPYDGQFAELDAIAVERLR